MYVCMHVCTKVEIVYTCIYTSVYVLLSGKYLSYTDISFKKMFRRQQQHFRPGSRVFIAPGILEVNRTTAVLLFPSTIADTDVAAERFTPIYIMFNCMYVCMYVCAWTPYFSLYEYDMRCRKDRHHQLIYSACVCIYVYMNVCMQQPTAAKIASGAASR